MDKEKAEALVKKYGSYSAAAKAAGTSKNSIWRAMKHSTKQPAAKSPLPTRTLADFRREHDQSWKIRDGIRRLFKGGVIMTDAEFREAVGGNSTRWRSAADASEFREYRYRVGGEYLWAAKDTIKAMRQIRGEAV